MWEYVMLATLAAMSGNDGMADRIKAAPKAGSLAMIWLERQDQARVLAQGYIPGMPRLPRPTAAGNSEPRSVTPESPAPSAQPEPASSPASAPPPSTDAAPVPSSPAPQAEPPATGSAPAPVAPLPEESLDSPEPGPAPAPSAPLPPESWDPPDPAPEPAPPPQPSIDEPPPSPAAPPASGGDGPPAPESDRYPPPSQGAKYQRSFTSPATGDRVDVYENPDGTLTDVYPDGRTITYSKDGGYISCR